jgi:uridine phosphorylase
MRNGQAGRVTDDARMSFPTIGGQDGRAAVYSADDFVAHLRQGGWDPGPLPESVIFTYGGFDLLCSAQPEAYAMNPMLGPGPGRFFLVNSTDGRVGVCCMGIGAPAVVAQLEVLASLGVRRFLSAGTAGGVSADLTPGDVVVLTGAIRDEGTSYHYVGPGVDVSPDADLTAELTAALLRSGTQLRSGTTWTTDAAFRETVEEITEFRRRGVLTVEMEAAALFAVAQARGLQMASAVVIDAVFGEPIGPPTMDTAAAFGKLYDVFRVGIDLLA